jgi:hypothetical protein
MRSPFSLAVALAWVGLAWLLADVEAARAEGWSVVLLEDGPHAGARAEALTVELAASRVPVVIGPPPSGETALLRSAAAQRAARDAHASFAVWVETTDTGDVLRAIDPESEDVRDAPLPGHSRDVEPRTFAAVAASLLDELVAPAAPPVRVVVRVETPTGDVHVEAVSNGEVGSTLPAPPAPSPSAPSPSAPSPSAPSPSAAAASVAAERTSVGGDDAPLMPRDGLVLRLGVYTAGVALGGEVGLGYYLSEELRLSVIGLVGLELMNTSPTGLVGLDLTRVGSGRDGRFDFGAFASLLVVASETTECGVVGCGTRRQNNLGIVAGAHIGFMWELEPSFGLGFRVSGGASFVEPSFNVYPYGLLTFVTEIGL